MALNPANKQCKLEQGAAIELRCFPFLYFNGAVISGAQLKLSFKCRRFYGSGLFKANRRLYRTEVAANSMPDNSVGGDTCNQAMVQGRGVATCLHDMKNIV